MIKDLFKKIEEGFRQPTQPPIEVDSKDLSWFSKPFVSNARVYTIRYRTGIERHFVSTPERFKKFLDRRRP